MSLIVQHGLPLYKTKEGFKYPKALEFWETHDRMVWHKHEIPLGQDVKDFALASEDEKDFLINILRLFTQNDTQASSGYSVMLRIFKPFEVYAMLSSFNDREITHVQSYANLTDTLGIGDQVYLEFLEIPVMETKISYLDKAKVRKYEEYKAMGLSDAEVDKEYRRSIARMLSIYGGGLESVSLMAQFAMLLTYQQEGKYPGMCDTVIYSIKDEQVHVLGNCWLFREFIKENSDIWDDNLKYDIYQGIREIVAGEDTLLDYLNPTHLDKEIFKQYVRYRADFALKELGMKPNYNITENPLPYMDEITAPIMADFFSAKVTEYSTALDGAWEDLR
ncbi:hypothetical protein CFT13S00388_02735 [Campylobacter fetus subsp. testudinum]|uniref:ribonucleotide-diphosphate reductase subunit beta n=1 Tax=Campylobacter fetus TaxID=196 RepID=UPI0008189BAE|nr:ribonucleotide-diphosphate reductase subunit beta [Campylobacter fetus]OCR88099.1 hypothetical protein CFT13S00388_02735 [Campylobacter fetus subsp. testudinum]